MDYTELTTNITEICESSFTADQLAMFTQQAENLLYQTLDLPAQRVNVTGTLTTDSPYLSAPTGILNVYSLAVVDGDDRYNYLLQKDVAFMREAYPDPTDTGVPKFYAYFDEDTFIVGPTPDDDYEVELHYKGYPESIVTADNTWLGDNFDTALLNGALVQAIRFMKGPEDMVALYQGLYNEAVSRITAQDTVNFRSDAYRQDGGPDRG